MELSIKMGVQLAPERDETAERAYRYAMENFGASEIELIAALRINRPEADYHIRRLIARNVLRPTKEGYRYPLA